MGHTKKTFNKKSKPSYEITIPIGDWSDDGHGKCEEIVILSSHPVEALKAAYLQSVQKTGLSFDNDHGTIEICTEYEERGLSGVAQKKLEELGFDLKKIEDMDSLSPKELTTMILWFIGLSLPDFKYEEKTKTYLNGYWDKTLNVHFGYGLFE